MGGLAAGAAAGWVVAWIVLTLFCYLAYGEDCADGYIAMVVLGPIGGVVGAVVGALGAVRMSGRIRRASAGAVLGLVSSWVVGGFGLLLLPSAVLGTAGVPLGMSVLALLGACLGVAVGWGRIRLPAGSVPAATGATIGVVAGWAVGQLVGALICSWMGTSILYSPYVGLALALGCGGIGAALGWRRSSV